MIRTSLRAALAAGTLALALVATAAAYADTFGGPASGAWNLPRGPENDGFAAGQLVDADTGRVAFFMRASLQEAPSSTLQRQRGTIRGRLYPNGPSTRPAAFPIYAVAGTWTGNRFTGEGSFEGILSVQRSPLGPVVQIGKIGGRYLDPPRIAPSSSPNRIGRFRGRWTIARQ